MNNDLFVKMAKDAWDSSVTRSTTLVNSLTDDQLSKEIAPGKNTGKYLMGHLIAVHDMMYELMGLGQRSHPELEQPFIRQPDKSGQKMAEISELRKYWSEVHDKLGGALKSMEADDFFKRHNSVSEEDFAKEPHRNKLNVLISRTNHLQYHLGQMMLLK